MYSKAEGSPEWQYPPELLSEGKALYDAVRPLFDVSNNLGLTVRYLPDEAARPHNSDRFIDAEFTGTEGDIIVREEYTTSLEASTFEVKMRLFSATTVCPDGISLLIHQIGQNGGYGGTLLPDGSAHPRNIFAQPETLLWDTHETQSIFKFVGKLIAEKRLRPLKRIK